MKEKNLIQMIEMPIAENPNVLYIAKDGKGNEEQIEVLRNTIARDVFPDGKMRNGEIYAIVTPGLNFCDDCGILSRGEDRQFLESLFYISSIRFAAGRLCGASSRNIYLAIGSYKNRSKLRCDNQIPPKK